jgi:protein-tyrosine phosphatase
MDYDWINERLALGAGITDEHDVDVLRAAGVTDVIDMRAEFDDHQLFTDRQVNVLWLPQLDDGTPRPPAQVLSGIQYALGQLQVMGRKIYVHCAAGVNRGPTEMYAILRAFGYSQVDAIALIKLKRPVVGFYNVPVYIQSVETVIGTQMLLPRALKCTVIG